MESYEKLGVFYLGRVHDPSTGETSDEPLLYDSKDLVTHAVCVGMTGSGKTGLCVTLLEEAAIDGIPVIAIDPKGDLTNLLLTFPDLAASSFRPWINEDEARQNGLSPDAFAAQQAELWKKGLAAWNQDGERIERLRQSSDFAVYTPGSDAGTPVSVLASFDAPPPEVTDDADLLAERSSALVTSLLTLLGVDADPLRSREHILLSTLLQDAWKRGQNVELGRLIQLIQTPPIARVGVLDLESFYPSKERFELAMLLNNLLASPRFQVWLQGEPLDVDRFLYTPTGKPRVSVFSIAHLDEAERMFFVSLLLNQTVAWMRSRAGTTSLRAILYMDEIFGFMPPVANPPSKRPLLTMLKQARAYGLGLVLATQNPVDLDYKGLANAGTWFIGRLQTERDKARILEGLQGVASEASAEFDGGDIEETINRLDKRVFLLHSVHRPQPLVFHTRWAMSYLAGPITRQQIKMLAGARKRVGPAAELATTARAPRRDDGVSSPVAPATHAADPPVLAPGIPQGFLAAAPPAGGGRVVYEPCLLGVADVHLSERGQGTVHSKSVALVATLGEAAEDVDWKSAEEVDASAVAVEAHPVARASFGALPAAAAKEASYARWRRALADSLYRNTSMELFHSERFKVTSKVGESEREFRIRLADAARESRDGAAEKLRAKYSARSQRLDDQIRRAEHAVGREAEQAKSAKVQTAVSFGATILSAFLGRGATRSTLGRATTAARGASRSAQQAGDVKRARDALDALLREREELNRQFESEVGDLDDRFDPETEPISTVALKPRKTDVGVTRLTLAWRPYLITELGERKPLWP